MIKPEKTQAHQETGCPILFSSLLFPLSDELKLAKMKNEQSHNSISETQDPNSSVSDSKDNAHPNTLDGCLVFALLPTTLFALQSLPL